VRALRFVSMTGPAASCEYCCMLLLRINPKFRILAKSKPADECDIILLVNKFGHVPEQFLELVREATEIEIQHENGIYLRFWGPKGCVEMDDGYAISQRIAGAISIGDDGGGRVVFYMDGKSGFGLYIVGYGAIDADDATWITATLEELLVDAKGINVF